MDNKIALERMKQLLYDISAKNEILNKDNNDLNTKILSLVKLLKSKDNQLENNKNILLKYILKNIINRKYFKEQQKLSKILEIWKRHINQNHINNTFKCILFYSHENDFTYSPTKKYNLKDIGVGDYRINYRYYIRKVACLTLLKRRKYYLNLDAKNKNQDNECKINLLFKNILPQNEVINMCIESNRSKKNENEKYDFSVFSLNIIHKNNKVFNQNSLRTENNNYSIISGRNSESSMISKEQYDKEINNFSETIKVFKVNNNALKLEITQKEKEIKNLEKKCKESESKLKNNKNEIQVLENEIINYKQENSNYKKKLDDYSLEQKKMIKYEDKYNKLNNLLKKKILEIKIDNINKNNLSILSERKGNNNLYIRNIIKTNEINIIGKSKNSSFDKIFSFNNGYFNIISKRRKKQIFKKYNFNLNIVNNNILLHKDKYKYLISKEYSLNFVDLKIKQNKNNNAEYDVIEPLKYEIDENKNDIDYNKDTIKLFENVEIFNEVNFSYISKPKIVNNKLEIFKSFSLDLIGNNAQKDVFINNFKSSLSEINKKSNYFKYKILELKFQITFNNKRKFLFFLKFQALYYQNKISNSFKMFRSLLINIKIKSLLKLILNGPPKYLSLKYYFEKFKLNSLGQSLLVTKNELLKNIETNNKLNSQINLFQETFKKYEESNTKEKKEKDNIIIKQKNLIDNLTEEISQTKSQFEKMKKTAKDSASELITSTNESNKQRKLIEKLNEEIKILQDNKIVYENQIKNQQEVIKNLNEKIKKDQFEYEQNEQDVTIQIENLKTQFNEYENINEKLNLEIINLKKENEKLNTNNENLNNNQKELNILIEENKKYKKENEILMNQNQELQISNENINNQYLNLKNDFDNLKMMSEESKDQLSKAMNEMESYSELLQALEMKIKEAENQKINAENERDKAINDVREIRQRYINIMGEKYA